MRKGLWQLDVHGERQAVDRVLVLGLVLPERAVALQQLVQHAAEAEPVGARVVRSALGQHLGRHVAVRAHRGVGLLLAEVAGQPEVGDADVAVLVEEDVGGLQVSEKISIISYLYRRYSTFCICLG